MRAKNARVRYQIIEHWSIVVKLLQIELNKRIENCCDGGGLEMKSND